jgi:hypothetical protein
MRRGRPCPICTSPYLPTVSAMLEAGAKLTEITKSMPFDKHQLQRHKRHAVPRAMTSDETTGKTELSDQRLARWMERTEEAYLASGLQGDLHAQVDALRSGIRAELEFRRRHEAHVEQAAIDADSDKDGAPSVKWLDRVVRQVREAQAKTGMKTNDRDISTN